MTTCEPCALREAGEADRAEAVESIRTQRLVLSVLNGLSDAAKEMVAELGGCRDCIARLAVRYLTVYATALTHMAGDSNAASEWIQCGLMEDLDGQRDRSLG